MNIVKNKILITVVLFIASVFVWTHIYFNSQNYVLTNTEWYSYKSKFVDNYIATVDTTMGRSTFGGNEIDIMTQGNSDIILYKKEIKLSEMSFDFIVPNNSYLDVLYNFTSTGSSYFRLSKSSLYPSGFYSMDQQGKFTKVIPVNYMVGSNKKYQGSLKQNSNGVSFEVDGRPIFSIPDDRLDKGDFGFTSGMIGAVVSNVVLNKTIKAPVEFYGKKNIYAYLITGLLIAISLAIAAYFRSHLKVILFIFITGSWWLAFDYFYYSKTTTLWNYRSDFPVISAAGDLKFDFESLRFMIFKGVSDNLISLRKFEDVYGKVRPSKGFNYCFKSTCESEKPAGVKKASDMKLALIGESAFTSVNLREGEISIFQTMHHELSKIYLGKMDVESFNYSGPAFHFDKLKDHIIERVIKDEINTVVIVLNFRESTPRKELEAFTDFLKFCRQKNVKVFLSDALINPEKICYQTSYQVKDILEEMEIFQDKKMVWLNETFGRYKLTIINPANMLFDKDIISKGNVWWDNAHLTSYGNEKFGKWISHKIATQLAGHDEK